MSLIFNGDLSTGDATQFSGGETDANTLGTITEDSGALFDSSHFYSIAMDTTAGRSAYFTEATTFAGQYQALCGKFKFKISNANVTNSARSVVLLDCTGAAATELDLTLVSVAGGALSTLRVRYRNAAGSVFSADIRNITLVNDTIHELKFHFKSGETGITNSGIARVWIDDVEIGTGTGLDIGPTRYITSIKFGCTYYDTTVARTLSIGDFKIATNSDYGTDAADYFVDYNSGSDSNEGTEASPWKYVKQANQFAKAGDTITILPGSTSAPLRLIELGVIKPVRTGTANTGLIIVQGESSSAPTQILATRSFPPAGWTGPDGNGEYSIVVSSYTSADPKRIYVCTEAAWQSSGVNAIDPRIVGLDSVRDSAGTAGSLTAGQWAYSAGTVYYKPTASETFSSLHIEIPCRNSGNAYCVDIATNYTICQYLEGLFAVTSCIAATANGTGSQIRECAGVSAYQAGILNAGAATEIRRNVGCWTINDAANSGDGILCNGAGTGAVIANICHDNANDGIAFSGTHTSECTGNDSHNNGYAATGNESGIEVTGTAAIKLRHNTCVGNSYAGILNQSTQAVGQEMNNNISAFNGSHGFNISATHLTALMDNNASYGNGGVAFNLVGTGSVSPTGVVTTNPLFTSAVSTAGMSSSRSADDYTLGAASPCREVTDADAIINHYWTTGARPECIDNAAPDRRACMGSYQA
jgi:hypothetical protein